MRKYKSSYLAYQIDNEYKKILKHQGSHKGVIREDIS